MRDVVVFCSDHINALGLIRTLGEAGHNKIECFCFGLKPNYILGSKYVSKGMSFSTCEDATEYLVKEYPVKELKPVLFTLPDPPAYHVDLHKDVLEKKFVLFNAGEQGRVVYWMDKMHLSDLAQRHGLSVPWSIKLSKDEKIPDNLNYPVFVKSIVSSLGGKMDEGICYSKEELERKRAGLISHEYVVMQFIKKVKEINYFGLAIKDKIYIDFYDVRDRFPKGAYGFYNIFSRCKHDELYDKILDMIRETKYQGLFDVEFLVDEEGLYYFMEINFRVDGTIYKLAEGVDLTDYWCRLVDLVDTELPKTLAIKKEKFVGMSEINDFRNSVLSGQVNVFVWLWQFLTADRRMLFNFRDPKPIFILFVDVIKTRLHLLKN